VILKASKWATTFYDDPFIVVMNIEYKVSPILYWLVTFQHSETASVLFAVPLPDGTIIEPMADDTF
jgi:hypothetical protein